MPLGIDCDVLYWTVVVEEEDGVADWRRGGGGGAGDVHRAVRGRVVCHLATAMAPAKFLQVFETGTKPRAIPDEYTVRFFDQTFIV